MSSSLIYPNLWL